MVGFVNWRLPKLKQMLKIARDVPLADLHEDDDRAVLRRGRPRRELRDRPLPLPLPPGAAPAHPLLQGVQGDGPKEDPTGAARLREGHRKDARRTGAGLARLGPRLPTGTDPRPWSRPGDPNLAGIHAGPFLQSSRKSDHPVRTVQFPETARTQSPDRETGDRSAWTRPGWLTDRRAIPRRGHRPRHSEPRRRRKYPLDPEGEASGLRFAGAASAEAGLGAYLAAVT